MMASLLVTLGLLAPVALAACVARRRWWLWAAFAAGSAAAVPALAALVLLKVVLPTGDDGLLVALSDAFLRAAVPEESAKLLLLVPFLRIRPASPLAAVLAGLVLGFGFASVENALYASRGGDESGVVRLLTAVPCHAFLGAVMAHYVALATATGSRAAMVKAWLVPVAAHGLYDLPLLASPDGAGALPLEGAMLASLVLAWLAAWTRMIVGRLQQLAAAFSPSGLRVPE